jgi:hypothetical protein
VQPIRAKWCGEEDGLKGEEMVRWAVVEGRGWARRVKGRVTWRLGDSN